MAGGAALCSKVDIAMETGWIWPQSREQRLHAGRISTLPCSYTCGFNNTHVAGVYLGGYITLGCMRTNCELGPGYLPGIQHFVQISETDQAGPRLHGSR